MEIPEVIKNNPAFLDKQYKEDLSLLFNKKDDFVGLLENLIKSVSKYEDLLKESTWVSIAEASKTSISDLFDIFRPIRYISAASVEDKTPLDDLLQMLSDMSLLGPPDDIPTNRQNLKRLCSLLIPLISQVYEDTPISIPVLRIDKMNTKCASLSVFENEFNSDRDKIEEYKPNFERFFPFVIWKITFRDEEHNPISIGLTEKNIDTVIKWLTLTKIQLRTTKEVLNTSTQRQ